MKKKRWLVLAAAAALLAFYILGAGFVKQGAAYIGEYALSPDGSEMTIRLDVGASAGFIRKVAVHSRQGGRLYLDCYAAFGGVNGSLGAKHQYTIPIHADTEVIAIYRNANCYEEVLKKDADGQWRRVG